MTQVCNFGLREGAFLVVGIELMLSQEVKNLLQVDTMLFGGFTVDEDIIQVNQDKLVEVWAENCIHSCLESSWRISEAKG
jgi:hypothetical protein